MANNSKTNEHHARWRKRLLMDHDADEYGIWHVIGGAKFFGRCDLGYVEGRYGDVIEWAFKDIDFWGSCFEAGSIEKIKVKKI